MTNQLENGLELMVQYEKRGGLAPVVVQDILSRNILMVAYANQQALDTTLNTGYATFWSTSRNELWTKGLTSGDMLEVKEVLVDCDQDALVYRVNMIGKGACHTKNSEGKTRESCFYRVIANEKGGYRLEYCGDSLKNEGILFGKAMAEEYNQVRDRVLNPTDSYTSKVLGDPEKLVRKSVEEMLELALSVVGIGDGKPVGESADVMYAFNMLVAKAGLTLDEIAREMIKRQK